MSSQTAAVIARIGADSGEYRKDLRDVVKENKRAQDQMARDAELSAKKAEAARKKLNDYIKSENSGGIGKIAGMAGEFAGLAGISLGAAGVVQFGRTILDFAGNLQDTSDAIGINVESLQELQGAFAQSGAGPEVVAKGLAKLSINLASAREGNTEMVATLDRLGVSWEDIQNLSPDQILMKIAASSSEAHDPAQRLTDIVDALGKSGMKMAAGLNAGSEALQQMRDEVSKLSAEEVALLDNAGDALSRFGDKAKVVGAKAILELKQVIEVLAKVAELTGGGSGNGKLPPGYIPTGPIAPKLVEQGKPKASSYSPAEAKEKAAAEKAQYEEFQRIEELREFERKQYVEWLGQKEGLARKEGEDKLAFEKRQFDVFKKYQEGEKEEQAKREEERAEKLAALQKKKANEVAKRVEELRNPGSRSANRRAERENERLERRAIREMEREANGGKSKADIDRQNQPSLKDRTTPREKAHPEQYGPNESIVDRDLRLRRVRAEQAREAMARGRRGFSSKDDFKTALDGCKMATDISEIRKNLQPV